jgi:hypothetical protein
MAGGYLEHITARVFSQIVGTFVGMLLKKPCSSAGNGSQIEAILTVGVCRANAAKLAILSNIAQF